MRILVALLMMLVPTVADAQGRWGLTFERGITTYSSAAHDTSSPTTHLRPWKPTVYALRVAREGGRIGVGLALSYARGELGVNVDDFVLVSGERMDLLEAAPELSLRLFESSHAAVVRVHTGPIFDVWFPSGEEARPRFGWQGGATLALPLTARWEVTLRGDAAVTSSFLNENEESPSLQRDGTMRRGRLGLGITRRL